jgi:acetoin utilization protein AcuB
VTIDRNAVWGPRRGSASIRIADVMTPMPVTIAVDQPLSKARDLMERHQIRHLPIMESGCLVGIVSQRELDLLLASPEIDADLALVSRAMTKAPLVVGPDETVDVVAERMALDKVGSAVVLRRGDIVGVFTTIDALEVLVGLTKS